MKANNLKKKGIKLDDNSNENLKTFTDSLLNGRINSEEASSFISSKFIPISAIIKSFELSLNAHKHLSDKAYETIKQIVDGVNNLIKNGETELIKLKATEALIKLAEITERMNESNNTHQRKTFKYFLSVILTVTAGAVIYGFTGGRVKKF